MKHVHIFLSRDKWLLCWNGNAETVRGTLSPLCSDDRAQRTLSVVVTHWMFSSNPPELDIKGL